LNWFAGSIKRVTKFGIISLGLLAPVRLSKRS